MSNIIGLDFDNTIVCYDQIFFDAAREQGLIPDSVLPQKTEVRNYLRRIGKEPDWTRLQGLVYGPLMPRAEPFVGVKDFIARCKAQGLRVVIVSHKTIHPYEGDKVNLHECARAWLELKGFLGPNALTTEDVFFEVTKELKIARIASLDCDWFIDDLTEIFEHPQFSPTTKQILFNPLGAAVQGTRYSNAKSWAQVNDLVLGRAT